MNNPHLSSIAGGPFGAAPLFGIAVELTKELNLPPRKIMDALTAIKSCYGNLHVPSGAIGVAGINPISNTLGVASPTPYV